MFVNNSLALLLCICFIYITFGDSVQSLDGNEGDSCFINKTQKEGICKKYYECEKPCSDEKVTYLPCGGVREIVCCPLTASTSSISASKCQEYKELVCEIVYVANTLDSNDWIKVSNCTGNTQSVIIGGEEAQRREFPHMALLGWTVRTNVSSAAVYGCGGTLISDQFVISAAHCFYHYKYGPLEHVRLGEHDKNAENESSRIDLNVAKLIAHPDYSHEYDYDDIGLIKLERKVQFTNAIRPVCLPQESIKSDKAVATGWGKTTANGVPSTVLMKVSLDIFEQSRCNHLYKPDLRLPQGLENSQFCAGSATKNNNTCSGDSGGPLQIMNEIHHCTFTIVGVTSFGADCSDTRNHSIGVYANVFNYLNWIEQTVWPEE